MKRCFWLLALLAKRVCASGMLACKLGLATSVQKLQGAIAPFYSSMLNYKDMEPHLRIKGLSCIPAPVTYQQTHYIPQFFTGQVQ